MNFSNAGQSTLANAMTAGTASLTVVSAVPFPAAPFHIVVDAELMTVTAVIGNTFAVTRGIEGTTAVAHGAGAMVTCCVTAGDYASFGASGVTSFNTRTGAVTLNSTDVFGVLAAGANITLVDSGGLVTVAAPTPTPQICQMRLAINQAFAANVLTKINLDTVVIDSTGSTMGDITNHRINIPVPGYYLLGWAVYPNGYGGYVQAEVHRTSSGATLGTALADISPMPGAALSTISAFMTVAYFPSADSITLWAVLGAGSGVLGAAALYTTLSASRIG